MADNSRMISHLPNKALSMVRNDRLKGHGPLAPSRPQSRRHSVDVANVVGRKPQHPPRRSSMGGLTSTPAAKEESGGGLASAFANARTCKKVMQKGQLHEKFHNEKDVKRRASIMLEIDDSQTRKANNRPNPRRHSLDMGEIRKVFYPPTRSVSGNSQTQIVPLKGADRRGSTSEPIRRKSLDPSFQPRGPPSRKASINRKSVLAPGDPRVPLRRNSKEMAISGSLDRKPSLQRRGTPQRKISGEPRMPSRHNSREPIMREPKRKSSLKKSSNGVELRSRSCSRSRERHVHFDPDFDPLCNDERHDQFVPQNVNENSLLDAREKERERKVRDFYRESKKTGPKTAYERAKQKKQELSAERGKAMAEAQEVRKGC